MTRLERVEGRAESDLSLEVKTNLAVHSGQRAQVRREHDPYHGSVCASTERTDGRSRTMGAQLWPASAEAYT